MELINENELENICGGGKISKVIETVSIMCLVGSMIGTGALVSYASAQKKELERRKHPKVVADHVVYIVEERHFC